MYLPFQQHTGVEADTVDEFLQTVRSTFDKAFETYVRTFETECYGEDIATLKFSFEVLNGRYAEAVLEDAEEYTNN